MGRGRGFGWAAIARRSWAGLLALGGVPLAFADNAERHMTGSSACSRRRRRCAHHIDALHVELLIIITLITLFVMGLLALDMVASTPSATRSRPSTTHNTLIEMIWTVVPVLILVSIAIPSFKLMYYMDHARNPT